MRTITPPTVGVAALGLVDAEGYLNIVGREKDLIISGGFNVYPARVENALNALDGVADSAVIGAPHPGFGEAVTAVVVPGGGAQVSEQEIRSTLTADLDKYKMPNRMMFVEDLPRNKMGETAT